MLRQRPDIHKRLMLVAMIAMYMDAGTTDIVALLNHNFASEAFPILGINVLGGIAIRVMNLRYARIGRRPKFDLAVLAPQGEGRTTPVGEQPVYHQGQWWTAQRFDRLSLPVGTVVQGPAILEQPDTTVWLEPGFEGRVDKLGNLLVERAA